jgi:2-polyprenyl-3-methyl-5-hydroxy-6-metoxy-1,4-benzoquinol methylase
MPTSALQLAPHVIAHVWEVHQELGRPISVLDVGPGFGKFGLLFREYVEGIDHGSAFSRLDAVETEPRYLARFRWLPEIYDRVIVADVCALSDTELDYDLIVMAEVLEHLDRDAALHLLGRIPGRVVISTPRAFFDNPEADEWESERHRSHWTPEDFAERAERFDQRAFDELDCVLVRLAAQ